MNEEIIIELRQEEEKYRQVYINNDNIIDSLKVDAFREAIRKLQVYGLNITYIYFKKERDKLQGDSPLERGLKNAYDLVVGKLWKWVKK